MKFPYGISDFGSIIRENYFYQDRTHLIPVIEDAGVQLLFLRPRHFGKSLLLSMLEHYYDLKRADQFDALFGQLAIGKKPTPLHNQYFVMTWNFSQINTHGGHKQIEAAIHRYINLCIERCAEYYQLSAQIIDESAISSFCSLLSAIQASGNKLYLLIDEYDHFANEVMVANKDDYASFLYCESLVKTVFKAVKAGASGRGLDKVFITGILPIVLIDLIGGYDVAESIYLRSEFNELCGFTEAEIALILKKCHVEGAAWSEEQALDTMRTFYSGYRFSDDAKETVYNPSLSLYFLKYLSEFGKYPPRIFDDNLAMDRNKLLYTSRRYQGEALLINTLEHDGPMLVRQLQQNFEMENLLVIRRDCAFMVSLLYYFGILTQAGIDGALGKTILKVPNLAVRSLYLEQLQELWLTEANDREAVEAIRQAACQTGQLQPLFDFIEKRLFIMLSDRDYSWRNERLIKVLFMTVLFNDMQYMMVSEMEVDHDYADLALIVRPDQRQNQALDLLFEFKYLSLKTLDLTAEQLRNQTAEELALLPQVAAKLAEAEQQAHHYGSILIERYGLSNLRCLAVVALDLEKLVYRKVNLTE